MSVVEVADEQGVAGHRVVVTGVGALTALGPSAVKTWEACLAGRTVVEPIPSQWHDFFEPGSPVWSPLALPDFREAGLGRTESMQQDPVALIAAVAVNEALAGAGFQAVVHNARQHTFRLEGVDPLDAGVFLGSGIGGASTLLAMHAHQMLHSSLSSAEPESAGLDTDRWSYPPRFNPFCVSMSMLNAVAAHIGIKYGFTGANETTAAACASGTIAIGRAYRAIRSGQVKLALAGGTEYLDDHYGGIFRGFDVARTLARGDLPYEQLNRPFDEARCGFLFAQGASGILVLEQEAVARARGATILAEVRGFSESFDAYSMMSLEPNGDEIERMLRRLLASAGLQAEEVGYINAHGTGTTLNDATEAAIIERVFGTDVMVNASKSLIGHTIGASGALEALITTLSLHEQRVHGNLNLTSPIAPLCFPTDETAVDIEHAITQSFAFGGHNAALLLGRYTP